MSNCLIVIDLYNDDCMLSVKYKLRLWLIFIREIDYVLFEVWNEAVVNHDAGNPQCHL